MYNIWVYHLISMPYRVMCASCMSQSVTVGVTRLSVGVTACTLHCSDGCWVKERQATQRGQEERSVWLLHQGQPSTSTQHHQ
jgi:hypothetical protein